MWCAEKVLRITNKCKTLPIKLQLHCDLCELVTNKLWYLKTIWQWQPYNKMVYGAMKWTYEGLSGCFFFSYYSRYEINRKKWF